MEERVRVIGKFVQLASELLKLHNFTAVNAVVSGLRLLPVLILEHTWANVSAPVMKRLKVCMCVYALRSAAPRLTHVSYVNRSCEKL